MEDNKDKDETKEEPKVFNLQPHNARIDAIWRIHYINPEKEKQDKEE